MAQLCSTHNMKYYSDRNADLHALINMERVADTENEKGKTIHMWFHLISKNYFVKEFLSVEDLYQT